jgi:hypothetical protein
MMKEKQEKINEFSRTKKRFPQTFYQAFFLISGIIDDIAELLKVFECS